MFVMGNTHSYEKFIDSASSADYTSEGTSVRTQNTNIAGARLAKLWKVFAAYFLLALALPVVAQTEVPTLTERVAAGDLPPVEERLPTEPLVLEVDQIGTYGGSYDTYLFGESSVILYQHLLRENLMGWNLDFTEPVPNVATSVDVNDDGSEYIFHLREGMRWSDGEPFTVDDIMFWYDAVFMNDAIIEAATDWLYSGDKPVVVEKVDDLTVAFKFAEPNGLFLINMAAPEASIITRLPQHYLEQFHADYNSDGIDALVREAGVNDWTELFDLKAGFAPYIGLNTMFLDAERPTIGAWHINTPYKGGDMVATRNAFYWKVDQEGNQLPYLDNANFRSFQDEEAMLLAALNGELDVVARYINQDANKSLFLDNMERGNYRLYTIGEQRGNTVPIMFNMTSKDPALREVFRNDDFRIGLSHAINRQEVIDLVFQSQGEPAQVAPLAASSAYNEELERQYTEYDPELANEHLDKAGYNERDAQGFRLGPDGERISFVIDVTDVQSGQSDAMQLVAGYWQAVGIDAQVRVVDRSLQTERRDANEHQVSVWGAGGSDPITLVRNPDFYLGYNPFTAPPWAAYEEDPSSGEEPPESVKRQIELRSQIEREPDLDKQIELTKEILDIARENFFVLGISTANPQYGTVKNDLCNVPDEIVGGFIYGELNPAEPSTWYRCGN